MKRQITKYIISGNRAIKKDNLLNDCSVMNFKNNIFTDTKVTSGRYDGYLRALLVFKTPISLKINN